MPITIHNNLPIKELLREEDIFYIEESRAMHQDIRPLEIVILNLMPNKRETEMQLIKVLSNSPLQINISFMAMQDHIHKNGTASYLKKYYYTYQDLQYKYFDGLIITGAPLETKEFEEVDCWEELKRIMIWSKRNVTSTLHICWGALAGLYYHYNIKKVMLPNKCFGVYNHKIMAIHEPLIKGFDDEFFAPHSRYAGVSVEDIMQRSELTLIAQSAEAGVLIAGSNSKKQIYVLGHLEYDRDTLNKEYKRDIGKRIKTEPPVNYYKKDGYVELPVCRWNSHANLLFINWLNYYVYQKTPFHLEDKNQRIVEFPKQNKLSAYCNKRILNI